MVIRTAGGSTCPAATRLLGKPGLLHTSHYRHFVSNERCSFELTPPPPSKRTNTLNAYRHPWKKTFADQEKRFCLHGVVLTERASSRKEHSTDERADTVAFAPDVEDADADDEDDPSRSDADLSDDEDGWGLAEMVTFHPDAHFALCAIAFMHSSSMRRLTSAGWTSDSSAPSSTRPAPRW